MNPEGEQKGIRRILVAIDASPSSMAALQAAADLAHQLDAELVALFVEDINLLRLADLPFARRISLYSATEQVIDREKIEREMRAHANAARRALDEMASRQHLRSSFRVARGVINDELIQASSEVDLIILGKSGWSRRRRLGSTTRTVIARSPSHILVFQETYRARSTLGVIYDGNPDAQRALGVVGELMRGRESVLSVLILAGNIEQAQQFQAEVSPWVQAHELEAHYRWLVGLDRSRLIALARNEGYDALVVPYACETLCGEALESFLEETDIPVFLVH